MDQLEIISPNGDVTFYNLDPNKGISNIGRHPENDIVVEHPEVSFFHAVLDHRQRPYNLVVLSHDGRTTLNEAPLPPNVSKPLRSWDTVQLAGHTLILVEDERATRSTPSYSPTINQVGAIGAATALTYGAANALPHPPIAAPTRRNPFAPRSQPTSPMSTVEAADPTTANVAQALYFSALPAEQLSQVIITQVSEMNWALNVEQYATCELTIINAGDLVASFDIRVLGLNPRWVTLSTAKVYLNEGDRTSINITITPPRHPSSRAGTHFFALSITSPNYPEERSQRSGTLVINPYYEFAVSELSPKQQTLSWFKKSGLAAISIINRGNSKAMFRLDAEDDERGCSFELRVPGESVSLARQAELQLQPEESISVPISITPYTRRMVGVGSRGYSFTITANLLGEQNTPRSVLGRISTAPLFGPWVLFLLSLLGLLLLVILLRPRSYVFKDLESGSMTKVINGGEVVTLYWEGSWFANWYVDPLGQMTAPIGTATVAPKQNATYELRVENFLSRFLPAQSRKVEIIVTPVPPAIEFTLERTEIVRGESVLMFIDVAHGNEVILQQGDEGNLILEEAEYRKGIRRVSPPRTTTYVVIASNEYGQVEQRRTLTVIEPTATPVPTALFRGFTVDKTTLAAGEPLQLNWNLPDADKVFIDPLGIQLPPIGSFTDIPLQDTTYQLRAEKAGAAPFISPPIQVKVEQPTPTATSTPQPLAPIIEFFTLSDNEIVRSSNNNENSVTLSWSVKGKVTNVQLSGSPNFDALPNLSSQSSLNLIRTESTTFILTAFNGEQKTSNTLQLTVLEPTVTTTPQPTPTRTPTATPTQTPPVIRSFLAEGVDSTTAAFQQTKSEEGLREYQVLVGSRIRLSWSVVGATTVSSVGTSDYQGGNEDLEGSVEFTVSKEGDYRLTASNANPSRVVAIVRLHITPRVPSVPISVDGEEQADKNNNHISWDFRDQDTEYVLGFRLYRASSSDNDFRRIATEADLNNLAREWDDSNLSPTCGYIYYLTTVYLDPSDNSIEETNASSNSWYSSPCE